MDYSDPNAFTLPYQLTKQVRRDTVLITGVTGGIAKVMAESWVIAGASGVIITAVRSMCLRTSPHGSGVSPRPTPRSSLTGPTSPTKPRSRRSSRQPKRRSPWIWAPIGAVDVKKFFNDFQVNVLGSYLVTHHFLAQADGVDTVISMTTGAIAHVFPNMASYTASKLALVRIMENLHAEQQGIRVFMLIPGIVMTDMTIDALKPYAKDSPGLSASWTLFLSTPRAEWMRGGIVSANWDIEEMEAHKDQIVGENLLSRAFLNAKLGKDGHPWT
ncbi:NAD(P)-binding protein [Xylariaceae sp. FL0255]|nr:NAD(P)-binding protein [Xylariaceae sp. FL0255]